MTNLAFTDVRLISSKPVQAVTILLGETCVIHDLVQLLSGKYILSTATDAAKTSPSHLIMQAGIDLDQVVAIPLEDGQDLQLIGATTVQGDQYVLSATPGKIAPRADLVPTNILTDIAKGIAVTEKIVLGVEATGIVL